MAYKAINEKFPPEVWGKINAVKEERGMTWAEFLPYAAQCVDVLKISSKTLDRLLNSMGDGVETDKIITTLLDFWEEEGDDVK